MNTFSTRQAAQKLGITHAALSKYISAKKIPAPRSVTSGGMTIHLWTEEEIEQVRKLLPKIANGRKTRYQKLREKQRKAPAGVPVPHKKKKK
jgi:predicted transcriptional regulator